MSNKEQTRAILHRYPKAELHVHLEGSAKFGTIFELATKNNVPLPFETPRHLRQACVFETFADFAQIYDVISRSICVPDDLRRLVLEFGERMNDENIVYSEVTWTPQLHVQPNWPFESWLNAVNDGRKIIERKYGIEIRWILDILRDRPEDQMQVADWATSTASMNGGVVALGLGGTEELYPPNLFKDAFKLALSKGLHLVPHAGEHLGASCGPSSILTALHELQAERIGHGNRAIESKSLIAELVRRKIPLELCPTSNVKLGVYKNLSSHSLPELIDAGCVITVNTDDPEIFNTTLTDEYIAVIFDMGCSIQDVEQIITNSFICAFDKNAAERALEKSENRSKANELENVR